MRKYVTEFIGTFGVVFTVGCAIFSGSPLAPLAIGAALMVLVYAGGHISGGHYNPAVTLGVLLRGKITLGDAGPYWAAQVIAAMLAEFIFTFALVYVVLNVATSKDQPGNQFFGLAIGFTVATGAFAVGSISGAAFNPAVAFGAMLMGVLNWGNFYIYLIGNLLGAAVAAIAFAYLNPDDVLEGPLAPRPGLAAPTLTGAPPATPAPRAGRPPCQAASPAGCAARRAPTGLACRGRAPNHAPP